MQENFLGDLYGQDHKALATHNALMLSVEAAILRRSNEPNEIFRLDVLVIEYVSLAIVIISFAIFYW